MRKFVYCNLILLTIFVSSYAEDTILLPKIGLTGRIGNGFAAGLIINLNRFYFTRLEFIGDYNTSTEKTEIAVLKETKTKEYYLGGAISFFRRFWVRESVNLYLGTSIEVASYSNEEVRWVVTKRTDAFPTDIFIDKLSGTQLSLWLIPGMEYQFSKHFGIFSEIRAGTVWRAINSEKEYLSIKDIGFEIGWVFGGITFYM